MISRLTRAGNRLRRRLGDRLDAQLANHAEAIIASQLAIEKLQKEQPPTIDFDKLVAGVVDRLEQMTIDARHAALGVEIRARGVENLTRAAEGAAADARRVAQVVAQTGNSHLEAMDDRLRQMRETNMDLLDVKQAVDNSANDVALATATAQDWAQVSIEWAEHMPDTIPPNILAWTAVSGEHWSSRWWAMRSANAFGMLAWWYMGAWPSPGPPTTPNTPSGQPIPPGAMYFNTDLGVMQVWNGSTWVNLAQGPAKATTSSLFYLATAGQTVFPLAVADLAGATFAFNQSNPEGLQTYVNGVRLTPVSDYTVNLATSTITLLRGVTANSITSFDILMPASALAPSGSANTVLVSPIVPDGVKTVFTGLTVAANGALLNVQKNEELSVSVDGVIQQPGAAYSAAGAQITFQEAPAVNSLIFIVWYGPAGAGGSAGLIVPGPVDVKAQTVTGNGALSINRSAGENVVVNLTGSVTSITIAPWPAVGVTGKVRFIFVNGGAYTIAGWPAGVIWPGGVAPAMTSGVGKRDIILLMSDDAGASIYGSIVGQDYR